MDLEKAVEYLLKVRNDLRSPRGVSDPVFISENMQRLAQITGRVEELLADYEEELEVKEMQEFQSNLKLGKSVNMSETLSKQAVGELKGRVARLKRLVSSSWSLISTAQSRRKHLETDFNLGAKIT